MKTFLTIFSILMLSIYCKSQAIKKPMNGFYFKNSKEFTNKGNMIWNKQGDFAVIKLGYWRGDCCGGVAMAEQVTAEINKDTVFYNKNYKRDPNCDSKIGLCGNAIDFVIDIKKYPNYRKLIFKEIVK